jgi:YidC/Oxa1 family membrane protein insertase
VQEGTFGFAGVDDHYFISAVVEPPSAIRLNYALVDVSVPNDSAGAHYVSWSARYPGAVQGVRYFAGPKDFDVLAGIDRNMVRSIDFGMFAWLVVPLLRALKGINAYVGNYGWSVVILTVLINLAIFPLRHKSVVSMRRMQEIQPEVKAIQDRYANLKMSDPAKSKMNTELMNLYRERGVNPASGCVPMLLTLPVLFAFYAMLGVAIELRGAPFVLWIHDLVAPDPYYVLPILMGITMFAQQKMTPTTADPTQQTMMLIMPVVFTFMSLWWSSGLLLYWTVSNIWGIGQQMITNRIIGAPTVRPYRPPAQRRVKGT